MKVGVLGGGQLGVMLAEALLHLDVEVHVLDPDPAAPAVARLGNVHTAAFDDEEALRALFDGAAAVTFDSENVPAAPLRPFAARLLPSLGVLETSQNRILEKGFLATHDFPSVGFQAVRPGADVKAAARALGFPCIVKSALGGYDGKGQHRLDAEGDLARVPASAPGGFVVEEVCALEAELSVIVARDASGSGFAFPTFENLHREHVLDLTVFPARIDPGTALEAQRLAQAIAARLGVVGLLTVEFFLGRTQGGERRLLVNELAPRTHNSGHVTRQACSFSQFDALARILAGVPLGQPTLHPGAFCMGNLLGDVWRAQGRGGGPLDLSAWADFPEVVDVFLYGKHEARPKRKMGHFVVHAKDAQTAMDRARAFRAALAGLPEPT